MQARVQTIETPQAEALTAEEVAALIADAPAPNPCAFVPTDAAGVDWVLRKIAAARAEAKLIRENMEAMARACERSAEALEWKYGGNLQTYLQAELESQTEARISDRGRQEEERPPPARRHRLSHEAGGHPSHRPRCGALLGTGTPAGGRDPRARQEGPQRRAGGHRGGIAVRRLPAR